MEKMTASQGEDDVQGSIIDTLASVESKQEFERFEQQKNENMAQIVNIIPEGLIKADKEINITDLVKDSLLDPVSRSLDD